MTKNGANSRMPVILVAAMAALALVAAVPTAAAACGEGGIGQRTGCKVDSTGNIVVEAAKEIVCTWTGCPG